MTHGPRADIINVYTTFPWEMLCEEIAKLKIPPQKAAPQTEKTPMISIGASSVDYTRYYSECNAMISNSKTCGADGTRTRGLRRDRPAL